MFSSCKKIITPFLMLKHISYTAASSYKTIDLSFMSLPAKHKLIFYRKVSRRKDESYGNLIPWDET
jgi:hypothetical protein